jgi:hypothetical protein
MRCSAAVGCAGRLGALTAPGCARWLTGVGLIASGCARWLTGVGLTATFAVGLALVRVARRGGAFFAAFFLIILFFLTVFLRLAVLVTVVFLAFRLGSSFCRHDSLPHAHCIWKVFVRSLPNKKVSQQARSPSSAIDRPQASTAGDCGSVLPAGNDVIVELEADPAPAVRSNPTR